MSSVTSTPRMFEAHNLELSQGPQAGTRLAPSTDLTYCVRWGCFANDEFNAQADNYYYNGQKN